METKDQDTPLKYVLAITANDGYYKLPWYTIEIGGTDTEVSAELCEDGVILEGDNLKNVSVFGIDDDGTVDLKFSTDSKRVLITDDIPEQNLIILDDTDDDGDFETPIKSVAYTLVIENGTESSDGKHEAGAQVVVTADAAPEGKVFDKWTTESEGTFAEASSASTTFTMPAGNLTTNTVVTIAATYKDSVSVPPAPAVFQITFDPNSGTLADTTKTTGTDGKLADIPTPSRDNYTFDGWYTAASGGILVNTDTVFSADSTVYAHWTSDDSGSDSNTSTTTPNIPSYNPGGFYSPSSYNITVPTTDGGRVSVSPSSASSGSTVTISTVPDNGYELTDLTVSDSSGKKLELTDKGNGTYTFKMPSGKVSLSAEFRPVNESWSNPFIDVASDAYYADAVAWAVRKGVTNGTTFNTFSPDRPCTRGEIVTFLWRANGSPKVDASNIFVDVTADAFFYDAVLWAVANGITNGTSANTFSPYATCTRGEAVTFLHRAKGTPIVSGNTFSDVSNDAFYASAVSWAVSKGVTNGTGANTFSPNKTCTRGEIVTFLYRAN